MKRFEVCYEGNGVSGSLFVLASTAELAIEKFKREWLETESTCPECWVSASWSLE